MFIFFLKGILLGLLAAIPVGPIGALCIERTLSKGRWSGFISGLGAATADGLYSAVAAFGITTVASFVTHNQLWIRLFGGIALLIIGIRSFKTKTRPKRRIKTENLAEGASDYSSTFLLTLTNPTTIVSFGVLFGVLGFDFSNVIGLSTPILSIIGVALGSALWWFVLSAGVSYLVRRFNVFSMATIQKTAAGIIIITAIFVLASILYAL